MFSLQQDKENYNCSFSSFLNWQQVFNPNLTGYSTGTGEFISSKARLNIAFPVAATEDALKQARILVQRIRNDPRINFTKHWKVLIRFYRKFVDHRSISILKRRKINLYNRLIPTNDKIFLLQLITIFFGANDICSAQCYNPEQFSPLRHAFHLRKVLDYLKTTLPRTLVNLIPTIGDIKIY